jgi:MoxR-like ATPase
MTMTDPETLYASLRDEAESVLIGNKDVLEALTIALLTRGHVLLEGVPGVAKTTIANVFARTTGLGYNRIQMTPDILPADITGTNIYREQTGEFELQRGPVFANVVVADEINRATPKTQSALLEAMQEGTVTIEGETLELPTPFIVIATQNPLEMEGVFELPEAQRDRFMFKLTVDLPDRETETAIIDRFERDPELGPAAVQQVVTTDEIAQAREQATNVHVDPKVKEYILDVVAGTREHQALDHGVSPRGSIAILHASKARAAIRGREFVTPDDVKSLAPKLLRHRVVLGTDAELSGQSVDSVLETVLDSVNTPETVPIESDGGATE